MTTHLMIDLETLGTVPGVPILSIGCVLFDPNAEINTFQDHFYCNFDAEKQDCSKVEASTIKWWMKQEQAVMQAAFFPQSFEDIDEVLLNVLDISKQCQAVWANSPEFDLSLINHVLSKHGKKFEYWKHRDLRTLLALSGKPPFKKENAHNPLADSIYQAASVQWAYKKLGV